MKCLCPYSGLAYKVEGFATGNHALVHAHPVFSLPLKHLVSRLGDWFAGRLAEEEKKLLFLAMLKQTELVHWACPATPTTEIVEQNIESLSKLVIWHAGLSNPAVVLPSFSISNSTRSLDNFHFWLDAWWQAKKAFEDGFRQQQKQAHQLRLEMFLEHRLASIETGLANETPRFLAILAEWADTATCFPHGMIPHPTSGQNIRLTDYWKELIVCPLSRWRDYPLVDWKELEDHIIDNLDDLSSTFGLALIRKLRAIQQTQGQDLGVELVETGIDRYGKRRYATVADINRIEQEALEKIASLAGEEEPKEADFKSKAAFLVAKVRWATKQKLLAGKPAVKKPDVAGLANLTGVDEDGI